MAYGRPQPYHVRRSLLGFAVSAVISVRVRHCLAGYPLRVYLSLGLRPLCYACVYAYNLARRQIPLRRQTLPDTVNRRGGGAHPTGMHTLFEILHSEAVGTLKHCSCTRAT